MTFIEFLISPAGLTLGGAALTGLGAGAKMLWDHFSKKRVRDLDYDDRAKAALKLDIEHLTKSLESLQRRVNKLEASLFQSNKRYQQLYNRYIKLVYMHNAILSSLATEGDPEARGLVNRVLSAYGKSLETFDPALDPLDDEPDYLAGALTNVTTEDP